MISQAIELYKRQATFQPVQTNLNQFTAVRWAILNPFSLLSNITGYYLTAPAASLSARTFTHMGLNNLFARKAALKCAEKTHQSLGASSYISTVANFVISRVAGYFITDPHQELVDSGSSLVTGYLNRKTVNVVADAVFLPIIVALNEKVVEQTLRVSFDFLIEYGGIMATSYLVGQSYEPLSRYSTYADIATYSTIAALSTYIYGKALYQGGKFALSSYQQRDQLKMALTSLDFSKISKENALSLSGSALRASMTTIFTAIIEDGAYSSLNFEQAFADPVFMNKVLSAISRLKQ